MQLFLSSFEIINWNIGCSILPTNHTRRRVWPIGMTFKMNAKLNVAIKRKICSPVGCRWRRLRRQLTFERKLLLLLHSDVLECHSSSQQQKVFRHFEESHILRWICQTSARIRILNVKSSWWKFTQKFSTRIKNTLNCRLLSKTRDFLSLLLTMTSFSFWFSNIRDHCNNVSKLLMLSCNEKMKFNARLFYSIEMAKFILGKHLIICNLMAEETHLPSHNSQQSVGRFILWQCDLLSIYTTSFFDHIFLLWITITTTQVLRCN